MKIKFDSGQSFQLEAIQSVVDIFDGQPLAQSQFEVRMDAASGELFNELGIGNNLLLADEAILKNVQAIQTRNEVTATEELAGHNFSLEMETGTGKTYVYLRTVYELATRYGFKKFIIVVPSVAIREGVWQNITLLQEHLATLYDNMAVKPAVYQSRQVSRLREFANSNQVQIMVMNIQAFATDATIIQKESDRLSGRKPLEFIQATNPVVILDEPQNMETETARKAIESLNPLCTLRYSATHRNAYNLLYRLDPVRAYDLGLVKRIEVDSVLEESDFNKPYIAVKAVNATKTAVSARVEIDEQGATGPKRVTKGVSKTGTDLFDLSGSRPNYRGYIVDDIVNQGGGQGYITFTNGITINVGETHGGRTDDLMRVQVRQTIREHLDKELAILRLPEDKRLKVLSLFFIDRVANYAHADGKIRVTFEEEYRTIRAYPKYAPLLDIPLDKVHEGYFAQDKDGPKDTSGITKADDAAYELIMRDKERLLNLDEPLRFIFSHSALREGWDNPNVFQICTLNETRSEIKKRQEIGRGLRLPVRVNGERSFDPTINRLTVIANESYEDFARQLQTEIEEECGVKFEGRIKNKRDRQMATLKKDWRLNPDFQTIWDKIKHRTRYAVRYDTAELIKQAAAGLHDAPPIVSPQIRVVTNAVVFNKEGATLTGVGGELRSARAETSDEYKAGGVAIPDLLTYLQCETELTRSTLAEILIASGRLGDVKTNPQQFLDTALVAIRMTLQKIMVQGIKYERIAGEEYEMLLFEEHEINGYTDRMLAVTNGLYDFIEYDSAVEYEFAKALDARNDIRLFFKLPFWFKIETPLGTYNPDWAIVKEDDDKVYLVRETKGTSDWSKLRDTERDKITCGKQHFKALSVDYAWVESATKV